MLRLSLFSLALANREVSDDPYATGLLQLESVTWSKGRKGDHMVAKEDLRGRDTAGHEEESGDEVESAVVESAGVSNAEAPEVCGSSEDFDFASCGNVFIKSAHGLYFKNVGSNEDGASSTLHECPKELNYPECQWSFVRSVEPNAWYIKASDVNLFVHTLDGFQNDQYVAGASENLHECSVIEHKPNCQWRMVPSTTRPDHFYICSLDQTQCLKASLLFSGLSSSNIAQGPCRREDDDPDCQWQFEKSCQDHHPTDHCVLWALQGKCQDELIANSCPRTCEICSEPGSSAMSSPSGEGALVGQGDARGAWTLLMSSTGGALEYQITEGVGREDAQSVTREEANSVGGSVSLRLQADAKFMGSGGEKEVTATVSYEHSWSIAREVSSSTSHSLETTSKVTCAAPSGNHNKVWLYQWVIHSGPYVVQTSHTRCHYTTDGSERAPECPFTACGGLDNEWCQVCGCEAWCDDWPACAARTSSPNAVIGHNGYNSAGIADGSGHIEFIDIGAGQLTGSGEVRGITYWTATTNGAGLRFRIYRPVSGADYTYRIVMESEELVSEHLGVTKHNFETPLPYQEGDYVGWRYSGGGTFLFTTDGGNVRWNYDVHPTHQDVAFSNGDRQGARIYAYELSVFQHNCEQWGIGRAKEQ